MTADLREPLGHELRLVELDSGWVASVGRHHCCAGHTTPQEAAHHLGHVVTQTLLGQWWHAAHTEGTYAHTLVTAGTLHAE